MKNNERLFNQYNAGDLSHTAFIIRNEKDYVNTLLLLCRKYEDAFISTDDDQCYRDYSFPFYMHIESEYFESDKTTETYIVGTKDKNKFAEDEWLVLDSYEHTISLEDIVYLCGKRSIRNEEDLKALIGLTFGHLEEDNYYEEIKGLTNLNDYPAKKVQRLANIFKLDISVLID